MLHLLLQLALAANPAARCERAVATLSAAPLVAPSLETKALINRQITADNRNFRKATRRCAALARQSPARADAALGHLAYARGEALRDAPGVPEAISDLARQGVVQHWSRAELYWTEALDRASDPALRQDLELQLVTMTLERDELRLPPGERTDWNAQSIVARAIAARDAVQRQALRELCLDPAISARAHALLNNAEDDPAWWITNFSALISLEADYSQIGICSPSCLEAAERFEQLVLDRPSAFLEQDAVLLTARQECVPTSIPDLALEAHALGAAAEHALAQSAATSGLESLSFQARAAQQAAEAHRLTDAALAMAQLGAKERVAQLDALYRALPQRPAPVDTPQDRALLSGMLNPICLLPTAQEEAAWLLFLAEPLAAAGLLSTQGQPILDRYEALSASEVCKVLEPCTLALQNQRALRIEADEALPQKALDKALTEALKAKVKSLGATEQACEAVRILGTEASAASVATMALAYEDMATSLLESRIPPYLTEDMKELYRMALADKAYPQTEKAKGAWDVAAGLDPNLIARRRALTAAPELARQEAKRSQMMDNIARYGSINPPPRSNPGGNRRAMLKELEADLDALEALVRANEACLSAETGEFAAMVLEQGRVVVAEPDWTSLADIQPFVDEVLAMVKVETAQPCVSP